MKPLLVEECVFPRWISPPHTSWKVHMQLHISRQLSTVLDYVLEIRTIVDFEIDTYIFK